jgi:hypothetical protein
MTAWTYFLEPYYDAKGEEYQSDKSGDQSPKLSVLVVLIHSSRAIRYHTTTTSSRLSGFNQSPYDTIEKNLAM